MPSHHSLTVAIPTYNGARHILAALRGILAQEDVTFDLIVCDDRSDDETVSLIRAETGDRAHIEINSERLGLAGNWNRCLERSQSTLVNIFHQDDVMKPGHLLAHAEAFAGSDKAGMIASAVEMIDDQGQALPESSIERGGLGPHDRSFAPGELLSEFAVCNPLRCSGVTLSTEAFRRLGGFDGTYRYVVDWEYWIRVAREFPVVWLAQTTVGMRWHLSSETHRFKFGTTDLEETEKLLSLIHLDDLGRSGDSARVRQGKERLGRAYLNRAYEALKAGDTMLSQRCLNDSFRLDPSLWKTILKDPRLAIQLGMARLFPELSKRLFAR